jgi:hypothetical protein
MVSEDVALAAGIYAATLLLRAGIVRGWFRPPASANVLALRTTATCGYVVSLLFDSRRLHQTKE